MKTMARVSRPVGNKIDLNKIDWQAVAKPFAKGKKRIDV
jgi:hypothetical protein